MGIALVLRVVIVIACLCFLLFTIRQISSRNLLIKYSLFWFASSIIILVSALFPEPVFSIAQFLGFDVASNFVFAFGLFFILVICLSQTRTLSRQIIKNKRIVQQLALLERRFDDEKAARSLSSQDSRVSDEPQ